MNDLEFTTRAGTTCDTCRRPTEVGFYHLHKGTPVLFDCVGCAERLVGKGRIDAALVVALEGAFSRFSAEATSA